MDLYAEEQIQLQKDIKKSLENSAVIPIPKMPEEFKAQITNEITANVLNEIKLNPEPFQALSKDFTQSIELLIAQLTKAITENAYKPLSEISVKNIDKAKQEEIIVSNLPVLEKQVLELTKAVLNSQPEINIEKQIIEFPKTAKDYIAVRLTDGKGFYNSTGGAVAQVGSQDPLVGYQIADKDDDAEPNYFGFVNKHGAWYIMKEESSTYRYCTGIVNPENGGGLYEDAWTDRANLTYDYFYKVF